MNKPPYPNTDPPPYPVATGELHSVDLGYPQAYYPPPEYPPQLQPSTGPATNQPNQADAESSNSNQNLMDTRFSEKSIRLGFIRKVLLILTAQLIVTVGIVCVFIFVVIFFITYLLLGCVVSIRRKFPGNYIALIIFTLVMASMAGTISAFHRIEAVLITLAMTALLCLALTLFALQTKIDFTTCSTLIFALLMALLLTALASLIVYLVGGQSRILQAVISGILLALFSVYLVFDLQALVGGRKYEVDPEDYIFASLQIYVDVVFIFMTMLGLSGDW